MFFGGRHRKGFHNTFGVATNGTRCGGCTIRYDHINERTGFYFNVGKVDHQACVNGDVDVISQVGWRDAI